MTARDSDDEPAVGPPSQPRLDLLDDLRQFHRRLNDLSFHVRLFHVAAPPRTTIWDGMEPAEARRKAMAAVEAAVEGQVSLFLHEDSTPRFVYPNVCADSIRFDPAYGIVPRMGEGEKKVRIGAARWSNYRTLFDSTFL
jgi:hypothetical protein